MIADMERITEAGPMNHPPDFHDRDHQHIIDKLHRLDDKVENGFEKLIAAFERECVGRAVENEKRIDDLASSLFEEKRRTDEAVRSVRFLTRIVWVLGGAVGIAIVNALLRGIGLG